MLFGQGQRIVAQPERIAEDRDLGLFHLPRQRRAITPGDGISP